MGLVLDSSVIISAERRGDNVTLMLKQFRANTGDQHAVISAVGLTELIHGIYRAPTGPIRTRREAFIHELLDDVEVYPFTQQIALLAGKIDGEQ
jgi:predicted nucleic acid-binding protein